MKKIIYSLAITSLLLLAGCASQTNWTPSVDTQGDQNAYRIPQDTAECKQLALQASGGTVKNTAIGAGTGGLVGGATGAAIGAISGDPTKGAILGATIGALGGAAKEGFGSEEKYKSAYINCMRGRGHRVY